ncbi:hypothetical protein STCU_05522, partial [Strigomonas culicis]
MAYRPVGRSVSPAAALGAYNDLTLHRVQQALQQRHKVLHVCLTGGPCAGKSTFLAQLQEKLPQRTGYHVMCVPEAATLLVTGGMQWDGNLIVEQQLCLLRTQLALEDQFYALAVASGKPTVIVSDRGTMDGRAFCSEAQFHAILQQLGCTLEALRDRYDAVLHMVTAAYGAEAFYNLDNPARYEDLDGARASDTKLRRMYVGHPMFKLIDNSAPSFDSKIERGVELICELVGHKTSLQNISYYVLRQRPSSLPAARARYEVTTTILTNSSLDEIRLLTRRVMPDGSATHFFRALRTSSGASRRPSDVSTGSQASLLALAGMGRSRSAAAATQQQQQRIECDQRISSREYAGLLSHKDATREDIIVDAVHFIFEDSNFELCTIVSPSWAAGRCTVMVETCRSSKTAALADETRTPNDTDAVPETEEEPQPPAGDAICFPPFLDVDREIPTDIYTTYFLVSHRETGPLYTVLAFAPVFSRATTKVAALGPHADSMHLMDSVRCSPNTTMTTPLRAADRSSLGGTQLLSAARRRGSAAEATPNPTTTEKRAGQSLTDLPPPAAATGSMTTRTPEKERPAAGAALLPHTPLRSLDPNTASARPAAACRDSKGAPAESAASHPVPAQLTPAVHGGPIRLMPLPALAARPWRCPTLP